jgi:hypothetical protein
MPNPWVSLRHDQLIPVYKTVNEKEQLEKGLEEEDKKCSIGENSPNLVTLPLALFFTFSRFFFFIFCYNLFWKLDPAGAELHQTALK